MSLRETFRIQEATPAAASTVVGKVQSQIANYYIFTVYADITGGTGGTLDVYLQREIDNVAGVATWSDWIHFKQAGAGAHVVQVACSHTSNVVADTNVSADAPPTVGPLAAGAILPGHPGSRVRAVYVAGAGTSAAGSVNIRIVAWTPPI